MSTKDKKEPDYQEWMRSTKPDSSKWSGQEEQRKRRLEAIKTRITIRLDAEIIEEFKRLSPEGKGYQSLINQALKEWLAAQGVKELLKEQVDELAEAVESIKQAAGRAA